MEIGSQEWLDRCCERTEESAAYREAARGWDCTLGLTVLDAADQPVHHALLRVVDGRCRSATEVDAEAMQQAPVRLTARYDVWGDVLACDLNLLKAIMLRRITLDGDLLHVVKHAAAARALIECIGQIDAEVPATSAG